MHDKWRYPIMSWVAAYLISGRIQAPAGIRYIPTNSIDLGPMVFVQWRAQWGRGYVGSGLLEIDKKIRFSTLS